jgi:hypothetical protein
MVRETDMIELELEEVVRVDGRLPAWTGKTISSGCR